MPRASLDQLVIAYRDLANWLLDQASELETGERKVVAHMRGRETDLTHNYVAEFRHKAHNLLAVLEAFERIRAQDLSAHTSASPSSTSPNSPQS